MSSIDLQTAVRQWCITCFGQAVADDVPERSYRFLEEALELVQSTGCSRKTAHELVKYVYDRDKGQTEQEIGGVVITLLALCAALQVRAEPLGRRELDRCWAKIDKIREKNLTKPHQGTA